MAYFVAFLTSYHSNAFFFFFLCRMLRVLFRSFTLLFFWNGVRLPPSFVLFLAVLGLSFPGFMDVYLGQRLEWFNHNINKEEFR